LPDCFDIQLTSSLKINKLGLEICFLGGFFLAIFALTLIPAQYMPAEMAFLFIFFILPRDFHLILGGSLILLIIGDWIRGLRKVENAKLQVYVDKITIESASEKRDIPYNKIKRIDGTVNLMHGYRKLTYKIILIDQSRIELRTSKEIYNVLTDYFPNKF